MTTIDLLILKTIEKACRDLAGQTASTIAIISRLDRFMPERSLRYRLKQMEQAGLIHRPDGPKSGWATTLPIKQGLRVHRMRSVMAA